MQTLQVKTHYDIGFFLVLKAVCLTVCSDRNVT